MSRSRDDCMSPITTRIGLMVWISEERIVGKTPVGEHPAFGAIRIHERFSARLNPEIVRTIVEELAGGITRCGASVPAAPREPPPGRASSPRASPADDGRGS